MPRAKERVWRDLIEPIKPRLVAKPPPPPPPVKEPKPPSLFIDSSDEEEEDDIKVFIYDKPPKPPQKCGLSPCVDSCPRLYGPTCQNCCTRCVTYELSPFEHRKIGYVSGRRNGLGPCGPCPGIGCGDKKRCFQTVMVRVPCCKPPRQRCYKTPRVWTDNFLSTDKHEMNLCYI